MTRVMSAPGVSGRPLHAWNFTRIACGGFGDPSNSLAHSMAWFHGRLYVGTTRISQRRVEGLNGAGMPYQGLRPVDERVFDPDHRAQIWRYDPESHVWQRVFESPLIRLADDSEALRDVGYRGVVVFRGLSDPSPALYVSGISTAGGVLLRSREGERFIPVSGLPNRNALSFRSLVPLMGRLYTSPVGTIGDGLVEPNRSEFPVVLENADPAVTPWRQVSEPGFGDARNVGIFEMAAMNGYLYAGTLNPYAGFQVWKACPGEFPYRWKRILSGGAFRGNANQSAVSMCVFRGALYIGTGIAGLTDWKKRLFDQRGGGQWARASQGLDYEDYEAGRGAAELLRIDADDNWDLIVGEPRQTPEGPKLPLSGLGPGFGNPCNIVIWRMAEYDGWLYAGTFDWSSLLGLFGRAGPRLWRRALSAFVEAESGFDLWRSQTGTSWEVVTRVGFGNRYSDGLRTLLPTPKGLFVGTSLQMARMVRCPPSGPGVAGAAALRPAGRAMGGSTGGCEIWCGHHGLLT